MPRKKTTAQRPFTMLVANLTGASDPSRNSGGNPVKVRSTITQQHLPELPGGSDWGPGLASEKTPGLGTKKGLLTTTAGVPARGIGSVQVANNDFTEPAYLYIGEAVFKSGEDFVVGGGVNATATNLAAAITDLDGYAASAVGAFITVQSPFGPTGWEVKFEAIYEGAIQNFVLIPNNGFFQTAEPTIGPPTIT